MNNPEQILKLIQHKIRHKRDDTLWNHIKTTFRVDYDYSGVVRNNIFTIWSYENWAGSFYPVIYGTIIENSNPVVIRITTKMNSFAFILSVIIVLGFFIGLFFENPNDHSLSKFVLSIIFASLPLIAINIGYTYRRKKVIERFSELVKRLAADSQIKIL